MFLQQSWQEIEQLFETENTVSTDQRLKNHQTIAHQYGFRFQPDFPNQRLNLSYRQLFDELFILEDKTGKLTIDSIANPIYQKQFTPNDSYRGLEREHIELFSLPTDYQVNSTYWVKLQAINTSAAEQEAWFVVGWQERTWAEIEIYKDDGTKVEKVGISGYSIPLEQKMAADWRSFIQIEVAPHSCATYYLRLKDTFHPDYPDLIALYHFDEEAYWNNKSFSFLGSGSFLGITFLLILLGTVLYYYGRDKVTLFFIAYLAGIWLHDFASSENIGASNLFNEFFPLALYTRAILSTVGYLIMSFSFGFFCVYFLDGKKYAPTISKLLIWSVSLQLILHGVALKFFDFFFHQYFEYPYLWITLLSIILQLIILFELALAFSLGITALRKKHPLAKMFLLANMLLLLGFPIGYILDAFFANGFSSQQFLAIARIGHLAQYILFMLAIVYKAQMERNQIMQKRLELGLELEMKQQEAQRLKELDSFKTRLYTNLTHEFRTPLTVILGMVEQMQAAPKKYFAEGTQLIERNGRNLLRLINQLLDLSKLQNNAFQLQLQQGDIITYLRYLVESFQTFANSHNLSLQFTSTLEQQYMDYDPDQLQQILTNLISNAVKFTPSGGHIQVKAFKEEDKLILKLTDTGAGIAEKDIPHIFDRFYQADNSATRQNEGTGLGLAHTQELVKLMDGTISVQSQIQQGTTFQIILPIRQNSSLETRQQNDILIKENRPLTTKQIVPTASNINSTTNGERQQLLIIEDNHDVVSYLKACLADQYQLEIAYNGAIGIKKALEHIPDLIVSDIMMPEKDGFEVCDTLKNDERTSHIPIILLTAKADVPSKIKGLQRGADAYLSKPFNKEELLVRVEKMIERQHRLTAYFQNKVGTKNSFSIATDNEPIEEPVVVENIFLQKIIKILEENYQDEQFWLSELCQAIGMSRSQFYRKMKAIIGQSPSQFIRTFRLKKAKILLEDSKLNINEISWKTGFSSNSHFSKLFKEEFGVSPREFKV
ncbi:MAG: ATP-binding protein [Saprospiraceae bacterium]